MTDVNARKVEPSLVDCLRIYAATFNRIADELEQNGRLIKACEQELVKDIKSDLTWAQYKELRKHKLELLDRVKELIPPLD